MDDTAVQSGWPGLRYFLSVVRTGSLRAAAADLGTTHATVDRHLKALERSYGVRLFDRSVGGLSLTAAGHELRPMAEQAEQAIIAAGRKMTGLDQALEGKVRLSVAPVLAYELLPPILAAFHAEYPGIELSISATNRFENLTRHETDVSVRIAFQVSDDVVGRKLLQYALGIYASRDYIRDVFPKSGPSGEGLTWLGWGDRATRPDWVAASPYPAADVRHTAREILVQAHLIRAGLGIGYLPVYFEETYPELARLPGSPVTLDRSIWLLLHSDLRHTARVRLLVDYLAESIRKQRARFLGPLA